MILHKVKNSDGIAWVLTIYDKIKCKTCGKDNFKVGYFCMEEKKISCMRNECVRLDNNYNHTKKYQRDDKHSHNHFKVDIVMGVVKK